MAYSSEYYFNTTKYRLNKANVGITVIFKEHQHFKQIQQKEYKKNVSGLSFILKKDLKWNR